MTQSPNAEHGMMDIDSMLDKLLHDSVLRSFKRVTLLEHVDRDLRNYGVFITKNGERIDPGQFYLSETQES